MKYAGYIIIMVMTTYGGYYISAVLNRRLILIREFLNFFNYIRENLENFNYTIEEIIIKYKNDDLNEFLGALIKNSKINGIYTNSWVKTTEESANECLSPLKSEELEIIKSFGENLGGTYGDIQIKTCGYYYSKLNELYEKSREKIQKEVKAFKLGGLPFGLFICLIVF